VSAAGRRSVRIGASVLRELSVAQEYRQLRQDPIFTGAGAARGDGAPVIVVPGFLCSDATLAPIHRWLARLGYTSYPAGLTRRHLGCGEANAQSLTVTVERVVQAHGHPVQLLGYSRGGHPARVVARRRPELVRGLVTLGTPSLDPRSVHLVAAAASVVVASLGSVRVPNLMSASCFYGDCCRRFRTDLAGALPTGIGYVALHSDRDGIVDHRYASDPDARIVQVDCSHVGYIANRAVYSAVAHALAAN
jgi:pimeloyl-ACP methyl ester carboxylesterase